MGNPIKGREIYDDSEGAIAAAIQSIGKLNDEIAQLYAQIKKQKVSIANIAPATNNATALKEQQRLLNNVTKAVHQNSLARTKANKQLIELRNSTRKSNRLTKLQTAFNNSKKGSYDRLSATYALVKIRLNAMSREQRNASKTGQRLTKRAKELYEEMSRLQKQTGKHTLDVGKYSIAGQGLIRTLKQMAAAYLSFEGLKSLTQEIFRQTRELDGLNLAYKQIIPNSQTLGEVNEFLTATSEKYGISIIGLRRNFLRFTAASKSSNLTMQEQMDIFDSLAKSGAVLGLGALQMDRAFNAVEQIMSKGKVSSEELRQQLGDSLPGSLEIMADALGVTTLELDKMLRKGEILSEDAMPKFAKQLEIAYGIQNVERVDNLAAAQGRFRNSITETIEKLNATNVFRDFFSLMAKGIEFIGDNLGAIGNLAKGVVIATAAYTTFKLSLIASNSVILRSTAMKGFLTTATVLATRAQIAFNAALKSNPLGIIATLVVTAYTAFSLFKKEVDETANSQRTLSEMMGETTKIMAKETSEADGLFNKLKDVNASTKVREYALKRLVKLYPDYTSELDVEKSSLEDIEKVQKRVINGLKARILQTRKAADQGEVLNAIIGVETEIADIESLPDVAFSTVGFEDPNRAALSGKTEKARLLDLRQTELNTLNSKFDMIDLRYKMLEDKYGDGIVPLVKGGLDAKKKVKVKSSSAFSLTEWQKSELERLKLLDDSWYKESEILKINQSKRLALWLREGYQVSLLRDQNAKEQDDVLQKWQNIHNDRIEDSVDAKKKSNKEEYKLALKLFKDEQSLEKANFESKKRTDNENATFALEQKRDLIKKQLELSLAYYQTLTGAERAAKEQTIINIQNLIDKLNGKLPSSDKEPSFLAKLLGVSEEEAAKIQKGIDFSVKQVEDLFKLQTQLSQERIQQRNQEVSEAQRLLGIEQANERAGFANKVELRKKELAEAKAAQAEAIKQRKAAQKAELLLQTALQASNLITAASAIWADPSIPILLKPIAIGTMFGSFAASKLKAFQLIKETRADGGFDIVGGGTHASGNDTPLNYAVNGRPVYAERGEGHMIVKPKYTRMYKGQLAAIESAANSGSLHELFGSQSGGINILGSDNSTMEKHLENIASSSRKMASSDGTVNFNSKGQRVVTRNGYTTTYV